MDKIRILVVDDSEIILKCLVPFLEAQRQLKVVGIASDGYQALDLAPQLDPDLILLDIRMPGMNGFETASLLRELNPRAFLVLTSSTYVSGNFITEIATKAGADIFISKIELADKLMPTIHRSFQRNEQLAVR